MTIASRPAGAAAERRNSRVFAAIVALIYLSAPVLYVGFVQAGLCKRLGASDTIANLPSAVFLAMAWAPVVVAWLYPQARLLRTLMKIAFGAMALASAAVAAILLAGVSPRAIVGAVTVHAAVLGIATTLIFTLNWEAIGRGMTDRGRGRALGLAYGCGPIFAIAGSFNAQLLLEGTLFGWSPPAGWIPSYPGNYALLYLLTAVFMGLAGSCAHFYRIPVPESDGGREPFREALVGGLASIVRHRVLFVACVCYILMYCGNMVQNNMSLYSVEATGRTSEELAGYQLALRFSFKLAAGSMLGWLLLRTHAKAPLLVVAALQIAGVLWALFVPGYWFLLAFGLNGAAELFGVYYVNYPVACSPKDRIRRNLSLLMLASSVVGLAPLAYGWISDNWGFRASFWAALSLLAGTTALVAIALPRRPEPDAGRSGEN